MVIEYEHNIISRRSRVMYLSISYEVSVTSKMWAASSNCLCGSQQYRKIPRYFHNTSSKEFSNDDRFIVTTQISSAQFLLWLTTNPIITAHKIVIMA